MPGLKNTKEWKLGADGYAFSSDNLIVRNTKEETHEMDKDWREDTIEKKPEEQGRGSGAWPRFLDWGAELVSRRRGCHGRTSRWGGLLKKSE